MMIGRSINLSALFKFHYDSINSMKELEMKEDLNEFKFHYDSINSACNGDWNAYQGHLNSIMILLIRLNLLNMERKIVHLNSIMILLIHIRSKHRER